VALGNSKPAWRQAGWTFEVGYSFISLNYTFLLKNGFLFSGLPAYIVLYFSDITKRSNSVQNEKKRKAIF